MKSTSQYLRDADKSLLKNWIEPIHLDNKILQEYSSNFATTATSALCIPNFLQQNYANMLASFMIKHAVYDKAYGLFSNTGISEAEWLEGSESEKFYKYSRISNIKKQTKEMSAFVYLKFINTLEHEPFVNYFKTVTNLPITCIQGKAYGHAFDKNDFLNPHTDKGHDRQIAFMIYLNPYWKPEFGGHLHFIDHEEKESVFDYVFNHLIIFDVNKHKKHFISKITDSAKDQPRLSIGGWYK